MTTSASLPACLACLCRHYSEARAACTAFFFIVFTLGNEWDGTTRLLRNRLIHQLVNPPSAGVSLVFSHSAVESSGIRDSLKKVSKQSSHLGILIYFLRFFFVEMHFSPQILGAILIMGFSGENVHNLPF